MGYKMLCGSLDEVQNEIFAFVGGLVGWLDSMLLGTKCLLRRHD